MPPKKPGQNIPGLQLLPGKKPAEKRPRQDTPSPAKEVSGNTINWQVKIQEDTKWAKGKIRIRIRIRIYFPRNVQYT
jgi:hypothetical protein